MTAFSIRTFGCRCNQAEAFLWSDEFQRHGLEYVEDPLQSDWVLVNTCTITSRADRDVRNFLRRVGRLRPSARMVVTGCYAERAAEALGRYPGVWKVYPNREKAVMPAQVLAEITTAEGRVERPFRSRPLVKIQDGCDFDCTFCVIPGVRGRSVSASSDRVRERVVGFMERGFEEVGLTGIHLGLYGRDLEPPSSLEELLKRLLALDGRVRFRLSSLDPRFLNGPLLDLLTRSPRICRHFHLSLQHGSDRVIARMGRKITTTDYRRILEHLSRNAPDAALGTDIIVGFPGETEKDFEEMADFLKASPLTYFHVFSYSPRPGTPAAEWKPVHPEEVKHRSRRLKAVAREKNRMFREKLLGRELEAVVIEQSESGARLLTGNYVDVSVLSCPTAASRLVPVRLIGLTAEGAEGVVGDGAAEGMSAP